MKRHPALRALSEDHHHGLVQARRLLQASLTPAAQAEALPVAEAFLRFWTAETRHHFRAEEEVLLPAFARYGDPAQPPIIRMLIEHIRIRQLAGALQEQVTTGQPMPETMRALGELLRSHIRYEEDTVFPLLEGTMPEEALAALPAALTAFSVA